MYDFTRIDASVDQATEAVYFDKTQQQNETQRRSSMARSRSRESPVTTERTKKQVRFTTSNDLQNGQVQASVHQFTKSDVPQNELWWSNADRKRSRKECRRIIDSFRGDDEYIEALKTLMKSHKSRITEDDLSECYEILSECSMARGMEIHLTPGKLQLGDRHVMMTVALANDGKSEMEICKFSVRSSKTHVAFAKAMAECDAREAALARLF